MDTKAWPTEIRVSSDRHSLTIAFDDGERHEFPAEFLRVLSPSAEVQGHTPSQKQTVPGKRDVGIMKVEPIGNYAVRISFDDLHDTGIYSWDYFRKLGGNVGVAGMLVNKDDGTGEAQAFAEAAGIPVLAAIPQHEDIRRKSANYQIIGYPGGEWGELFEGLADNLCAAPPTLPTPLSQDELIALFDTEKTGGGFTLEPATIDDMCAASTLEKESLEVVYDTV